MEREREWRESVCMWRQGESEWRERVSGECMCVCVQREWGGERVARESEWRGSEWRE